MMYPRTDLALELHEQVKSLYPDLDGVASVTEKDGEISVTHVQVKNSAGAERLGKPIGNYITLETEALSFQDTRQYEQACLALKKALSSLHTIDKSKPVLVVGLGNRFITADALGPKTIDRIFVTRHMHAQLEEIFDEVMTSVCAVAPGVLGITGVETAEVVQGVCARVRPGLILVVDALAARDTRRINTTIQLCDTGIAPGSGVGNSRVAFNKERSGVPVLAIGVPTVIDAMTMAYDAACGILYAMQAQSGDVLSCVQKLSDAEIYEMVQDLMADEIKSMTVTPKEVDFAMERISKVLSGGINLYLHSDLTIEELDSLTM